MGIALYITGCLFGVSLSLSSVSLPSIWFHAHTPKICMLASVWYCKDLSIISIIPWSHPDVTNQIFLLASDKGFPNFERKETFTKCIKKQNKEIMNLVLPEVINTSTAIDLAFAIVPIRQLWCSIQKGCKLVPCRCLPGIPAKFPVTFPQFLATTALLKMFYFSQQIIP